jgi:hypothetical protein
MMSSRIDDTMFLLRNNETRNETDVVMRDVLSSLLEVRRETSEREKHICLPFTQMSDNVN